MKILIGIVMLLCVSKIETRQGARAITRNLDDRDDYRGDDLSSLFDFADDEPEGEDYQESVLDENEEQMLLETILKLIQAKFWKYKKPKKEEEPVYKYKDLQKYQQKYSKYHSPQKGHYDMDHNQNNNYQVDEKKQYEPKTSCRIKLSMCLHKCDYDYRCRNACSSRYQC